MVVRCFGGCCWGVGVSVVCELVAGFVLGGVGFSGAVVFAGVRAAPGFLAWEIA